MGSLKQIKKVGCFFPIFTLNLSFSINYYDEYFYNYNSFLFPKVQIFLPSKNLFFLQSFHHPPSHSHSTFLQKLNLGLPSSLLNVEVINYYNCLSYNLSEPSSKIAFGLTKVRVLCVIPALIFTTPQFFLYQIFPFFSLLIHSPMLRMKITFTYANVTLGEVEYFEIIFQIRKIINL